MEVSSGLSHILVILNKVPYGCPLIGFAFGQAPCLPLRRLIGMKRIK